MASISLSMLDYLYRILVRDAARAAVLLRAAESLRPRPVASRTPLPDESLRLDFKSEINRWASLRGRLWARNAASMRRTELEDALVSALPSWSDGSNSSA